jgi:hypothetical protein
VYAERNTEVEPKKIKIKIMPIKRKTAKRKRSLQKLIVSMKKAAEYLKEEASRGFSYVLPRFTSIGTLACDRDYFLDTEQELASVNINMADTEKCILALISQGKKGFKLVFEKTWYGYGSEEEAQTHTLVRKELALRSIRKIETKTFIKKLKVFLKLPEKEAGKIFW